MSGTCDGARERGSEGARERVDQLLLRTYPHPNPKSEIRNPQLTVVIPTYNRSASLRRCVEGLFACRLAMPGGELLSVAVRIVDDGSPDDTETVALDLAARAPTGFTVHYHRQENAGQSRARNRGLKAADTDLVIFIDDDCVPDPCWLQAIAGADWAADVGGVGGRLIAAEQGNAVSRFCRFIRYNEYPPDAVPVRSRGREGDRERGSDRLSPASGHPVSQSAFRIPHSAIERPVRFLNSANCAYRRDLLLRLGGYEACLARGVDHDLGWRIALSGNRLSYTAAAVVHHHHREDAGVLIRDHWRRAHFNVLRRCQWEFPLPTAADLRREEQRIRSLRLHPPLLPVDAVRLLKQGVAPGDCLLFAYLRWRIRLASREGKAAMIRRLLNGEQKVERETPLPRDADGKAGRLPWMGSEEP